MYHVPIYTYLFSSEPPKFAIVDFEFTNLGKNNLILISGAILGRYEPIVTKLEGRALKLNTKTPVTEEEWKAMVRHLVKIFAKKPKTLFPILAQIHDSDHTNRPNLNAPAIQTMLNKYDALIMWEGSTDRKILELLNINVLMLNLRGWDVDDNGYFELQLTDMTLKKVFCAIPLGKFKKQGRALKLSEAHSMLCKGDHGAPEAHNPKTDALWTRCLFGKLRLKYRKSINDIVFG